MWIRWQKPKEEQPDDVLLELYRSKRDMDALGRLFDRYIELIYGVCLKYLQHEEKSRDAVLAIFEVLVRKLPDHEISNFKSWLYVLTKNHCLQILRKEKKLPIHTSEPSFMHSMQILHHDIEYGETDDHQQLYACLDKLSGEQKQAIELFYFKKKSYLEIADMMQVPRDSVRSYIQNGRRNLKICMEKHHAKKPG